ncbi:MAG: 2OG-Fe(II) oxygenase [Candidatus Eremiobacteraeota bacterium]|nr:2OG-Fe(II) oxygenase [Candidatus Eremiobacteraeota bacterium]
MTDSTLRWKDSADELEARGFAVTPSLLDADACAELRARFDDDDAFRNTVVMERLGYGRGVYRYFRYPLPPLVERMREQLYAQLAPVANAWSESLSSDTHYPAALAEFLAHCHANGQTRPTPLLLRYRAGDHNALHQDVYGDVAFPLQATVLLSEPGADFAGGEFVLVEQRPRKQSLAHVVPLRRGDAVVFPNSIRPARGARGFFRTTFRHGVGEVRGGERVTLGLIFHDAR